MRETGVVAALLAFGAALRLIPLLAPHPVPHPDEFNAVYWPLLVALGDATPEVFYYPYFHTYLLALLQLIRGLFVAPSDMTLHVWLGVQYFDAPASVLQMARWFQTVCSCLTLILVGRLAGTVYGRHAGWLAMVLASVSVLAVRQTAVAGLDVAMTMWFVAAVLAAVRLVSTSTTMAYVLAGVLTGLTASTKYHGALAAVPIVAAHVLCHRSLADRRLWWAGAAAVAVFLAGSPYTVLSPGAFLDGFGALVTHAQSGLLDLGPGWLHHVLVSLRANLGWPGLACLVVGLVLALRGQTAERVVAAGFLGYYLVIGASPLVFVRYALPVAMLQCVLVASALIWCARRTAHPRWVVAVGLVCVALPSAWASMRIVDMLHHPTRASRRQTGWKHMSRPGRRCAISVVGPRTHR